MESLFELKYGEEERYHKIASSKIKLIEQAFRLPKGSLGSRKKGLLEDIDLSVVVLPEKPKDPYDFSEYSFEKTGEYLTFSEIA